MGVPGDGQRWDGGSGAAVPLYGVFALTGVGTALLGATLPALLVPWRLTDASAGVLFLVLFLASSGGSLVRRRNRAAVVGAASGGLAVCCAALALTHGWAVFPETAAFGFGLGMGISTVTRVRLLCPPANRLREVNRLNLVWGLGAFLCPAAANAILRHAGVRALFFTLAGAFAAGAVGTLAGARMGQARVCAEAPEKRSGAATLPWLAAMGAFLAVGLESSLGAWLATYAHRLQSGFAVPVEATTLFWLGLLGSRALCSTAWLRGLTLRQTLLGFLGVTAAGCAVLLGFARGEAVLAAALSVGFGLGPVFPLLLAAVLPRVRGNAIFVVAGVGASALPWLTGTLSQHFGSLRVGLAAPVAAGIVLLAIGPRLAAVLAGLEGETATDGK